MEYNKNVKTKNLQTGYTGYLVAFKILEKIVDVVLAKKYWVVKI